MRARYSVKFIIRLEIRFFWRMVMIIEFIVHTCGNIITQIKMQVSTRLKEHMRATRLEQIDKSLITEHFYIYKHNTFIYFKLLKLSDIARSF